jgi:hypothetical protein
VGIAEQRGLLFLCWCRRIAMRSSSSYDRIAYRGSVDALIIIILILIITLVVVTVMRLP